jgi:hypothetical protein
MPLETNAGRRALDDDDADAFGIVNANAAVAPPPAGVLVATGAPPADWDSALPPPPPPHATNNDAATAHVSARTRLIVDSTG